MRQMLLMIGLACLCSEAQATVPCPTEPQPLPPPLDFLAPITETARPYQIEFSAKPALRNRAWVVRLYAGARGDATAEFIHLQSRQDCNVYDVKQRTKVALPQARFSRLATDAASFVIPSTGAFAPDTEKRENVIMLDGTGLDLRMRNGDRQVSREMNRSATGGEALFGLFDQLANELAPDARFVE